MTSMIYLGARNDGTVKYEASAEDFSRSRKASRSRQFMNLDCAWRLELARKNVGFLYVHFKN